MHGGRDRRSDLRPSEQVLTDQIKSVVEHVLADRASLKKNGHTMEQWLGKVFTVDRIIQLILAAIILFYNVAGDVRDVKRDMKAAAERSTIASEAADVAAAKSAAAAKTAEAATQQMLEMRTELTTVIEGLKKQQTVSDNLSERVSLNVSRNEFRAALNQQVLPRLERIEKKVESK